jgi:hypothetical protein
MDWILKVWCPLPLIRIFNWALVGYAENLIVPDIIDVETIDILYLMVYLMQKTVFSKTC